MKSLFILSALISLVSFNAVADSPSRVGVSFNRVYVPEGFDSNDNVQFVGEGFFANSCYRPAQTTVKVDEKAKTITVSPVAYEYEGLCLQVILPFDRVVDLGPLPAGDYTIVREKSNEELGQVNVAQATTRSADDFLYAPVEQAYLHQKNGKKTVYLTGQFPISCMKLQEVKAEISNDVIVLQPIVEMGEYTKCTHGKFPFEAAVDVSSATKGRYLIHVRSMNGKAINSLVDIR